MVTEEQILEIERKCEEIRKRHEKREVNENKIQFNSIQEAIEYFHAEPLDEFEKRFMSGE